MLGAVLFCKYPNVNFSSNRLTKYSCGSITKCGAVTAVTAPMYCLSVVAAAEYQYESDDEYPAEVIIIKNVTQAVHYILRKLYTRTRLRCRSLIR